MLTRLVYICSTTFWPTEEDHKALLEQARLRNKRQNVTGMLLYRNATYLQVLEGEQSDVSSIFESIQRDPRCTGIVKLLEEPIAERDFPDWQMGFEDLEHYEPEEIPGFSEIFEPHFDREAFLDTHNRSRAVKLILSFANRL